MNSASSGLSRYAKREVGKSYKDSPFHEALKYSNSLYSEKESMQTTRCVRNKMRISQEIQTTQRWEQIILLRLSINISPTRIHF